MLKPDPTDPIVVTGMGVVSPLGVGVPTMWRRLTSGERGQLPVSRDRNSA